jgi:hypothetical protein
MAAGAFQKMTSDDCDQGDVMVRTTLIVGVAAAGIVLAGQQPRQSQPIASRRSEVKVAPTMGGGADTATTVGDRATAVIGDGASTDGGGGEVRNQ